MHEKIDKQTYPVLFCGMPKAVRGRCIIRRSAEEAWIDWLKWVNPFQIGAEEVSIADGATTLSGTPVSEGFVIGTARVIDDIYTEMNSIKRGDIVITTATDAGELFFRF